MPWLLVNNIFLRSHHLEDSSLSNPKASSMLITLLMYANFIVWSMTSNKNSMHAIINYNLFFFFFTLVSLTNWFMHLSLSSILVIQLFIKCVYIHLTQESLVKDMLFYVLCENYFVLSWTSLILRCINTSLFDLHVDFKMINGTLLIVLLATSLIHNFHSSSTLTNLINCIAIIDSL